MKNKIIFEVLPPAKTASEKYTNKVTDRIIDVINDLNGINILNIPEIVEENHIGQPYYRNADIREYGNLLREKTGKEIMANTVVVHKPKEQFTKWMDESINRHGIKNFVFVGAKIEGMKYPGLSVQEANEIANKMDVNFGNIFIPDRPNEVERLLSKTKAGCRFFTSQVLFEYKKVINVINDYLEKCSQQNLNPSRFYLSFAPVSSSEDIIFLKWLGTEINRETESMLKTSIHRGETSIKIIQDLINKIFSKVDSELGLNVEYIMLHNLDLTKNLTQKILEQKRQFRKV